jgi:hypothetical protein
MAQCLINYEQGQLHLTKHRLQVDLVSGHFLIKMTTGDIRLQRSISELCLNYLTQRRCGFLYSHQKM